MDRINGAGTIDIGAGRRGFRDEDLALGQEGTEVTALWLNMTQEEMIKVIEAAGLVLNPADWTQLWQALQILGLSAGARSRRWVAVTSMTLSSAPGAPAAGDTYLIPAGATGIWSAHVGKVAEWSGTAWFYFTPADGHGISLPDGRVFERIAGAYVEKLALDVQSGKWRYAVAGGTANAITANLTPAVTSYTEGMVLTIKIAATNTGNVTLNAGGGPVPVRSTSGGQLQPGDLIAGSVYQFQYNGVYWSVSPEAPRVMGGDVTLFVRTDGSDVNDGSANTAAGAFLTIQRAISEAQRRYVSAGFKVTIQVADGTYAPFQLVGGSALSIRVVGNVANPQNCIINAPAGQPGIKAERGSTLEVTGFRVTGGNHLLLAYDRSAIVCSNMQLGNCSAYQIFSSLNSTIDVSGTIRVVGNGTANAGLFVASTGGLITCSASVIFDNAIAYSIATVWADGARIYLTGTTWTNGNLVGLNTRYTVGLLGLIFTGGGGANFIPGTSAGVSATGGLYA